MTIPAMPPGPAVVYRVGMPGRPLLQKLDQVIDQLGGERWIFERISDGFTFQAIADELSGPMGAKFNRSQLYLWIDLERERRRELLREARMWAATSHTETAQQ